MADSDRNPTNPVSASSELEALLQAAPTYDFFTALRWLQARVASAGIGTAVAPGKEQIRLAQEPSLAFAPTAIAGAGWNEEKGRVELKVRFTGLLGPNGPMPLQLTEYILDRLHHAKDPTLAAFLDVFQHRIYSLFFRAWALNQPAVSLEEPDGRRHAHYLRCLAGLGTGGTADRDGVADFARIYYVAWLGGLSRSPDGLAAILSDYLGVPVDVRSFQGMRLELPPDSRCQVGRSRATGELGATCFAGDTIWAAHLKFRLRFGPLGWSDYHSLLPSGEAYRRVADWVVSYVGDELFWEMQLVLRRTDVPECRLGGGVLLGWSTWLGVPATDRDVDDLVFQAA